MSDTPETDAAAESNIYGVACKVDVDFDRKLERERNKAEAGWLECRNFAQQMVDERDRYKSDAEVITKERDEARKQLRVAVGLLSTTPRFQDKHPEEVLKFVEEAAK